MDHNLDAETVEKTIPKFEEPEALVEWLQGESGKYFDSVAAADFTYRVDEVKDLPIEDTVWFILDICPEGPERVLGIQDKRLLIQGLSRQTASEVSLTKQSYDLICFCALKPMTGHPRKPRYVTFSNPELAQQAVELDLTGVGIRYLYAGLKSDEDLEQHVRMRECSVCRLRGSKELFKKCSSCHAMYYCSRKCQKRDWSGDDRPIFQSHKKWCVKMKEFMEETDMLRQLPFTFAPETTSESFDMPVYRRFLEKHGIYNQGMWRRECPTWVQTGGFVQFGDLLETADIVLPVESSILDDDPGEMTDPVKDWEGYYRYRGFRLDSPVAILLQYPLTLFHILKYCLPLEYSSWWENIDSEEICIDLVGVEKEVELMSLFSETARLLPETTLDIHMYGNEMSRKLHGKTFQFDKVQVTVIRNLYHKDYKSGRKPHVVVGFNAGLAAYKSWSQTIVKLRTQKIPAYFTDYCQFSCECSRRAVQELGLGTISYPVINPFRSPVRKLAEENDMPWFSNGFLFHLVYP